MPSSFLPSLPTGLPSYPAPITTNSHYSKPLAVPGGKRSKLGSLGSRTFGNGGLGDGKYGSPPPLSRFYDTPQDPRYVLEDSDNEMDFGIARGGSLYGEKSWRSSMGQIPANRKRGRDNFSDDEYEDEDEEQRREQDAQDGGRAKKRKIIDMVGTVFGKVWEICKSTSFYPVSVLTGTVSAGTCSAATPSPNDDFQPFPLLRRETSRSESSPSPPPQTFIRSPPQLNTNLLTERPFNTLTPTSTTTPTAKTLQKDWVFVTPSANSPTHSVHRRATSAHIPRRTARPSPRYKKPKPRSRASTASVVQVGGLQRRFTAPETFDESDDEEDESIRRFNEKLKAMIREGKEALGAKVEVYYEE